MTIRAVFDCMIYLQAASNWNGASGECIRRSLFGDFELCQSLQVLAEIRDVLTRPKIEKKFPELTLDRVNQFLKDISRYALQYPQPPTVFSLPRDPNDEKYLNLAIASNAQYLVTRDNDLLDLMKDENFRSAYPTLEIVKPDAFLQLLAPR